MLKNSIFLATTKVLHLLAKNSFLLDVLVLCEHIIFLSKTFLTKKELWFYLNAFQSYRVLKFLLKSC